ncbi:hypothetical protein JDFR1000234_67 [uncultured archaeal virus]|jgi:coenzyme F420-reducing hydrogenase alpha subunit|uniref:Uncharacterized protein n=1 Tax=uncultured archaeal virus TaxID=1960247 RepID=A0A1S5Y376_9VIRU|nr:hypothetical protein JDFR1000234_67 [uncultured archaeal virus]
MDLTFWLTLLSGAAATVAGILKKVRSWIKEKAQTMADIAIKLYENVDKTTDEMLAEAELFEKVAHFIKEPDDAESLYTEIMARVEAKKKLIKEIKEDAQEIYKDIKKLFL